MDITAIWETSVSQLREQVSKEIFDTWFQSLSLGELNDSEATIRVPNTFYRDWVRDHYQGLFEQTLRGTTGKDHLRVGFVVSEPEAQAKAPSRENVDRPGGTGDCGEEERDRST